MNWHQKIIARVYRPNYEKIKKNIMKAEVISFDIYDTMIRRNVMSSTDIFELVEIEFYHLTGRHITNYKKMRCESEYITRKKSSAEEITLEQIFENMNDVSSKDKAILKELEIRYELELSCPNTKIIELYKFALKNNKKVIITSDMYLGEDIIKSILERNGIMKYEKLYLSSVYKKSKHKGSLYKCILEDFQIQPQNILHIGDSVQSDKIQAQIKGIKTRLVPRYFYNLKYWGKHRYIDEMDKIQYSVLKAFLNNNISNEEIDSNEENAKRIGFEVLGPILAGYSLWLNNKIKKDGIDKVFFLAREGKIFQQSYNILYGKNSISQSYLYVSRRAAIVPLLSTSKNFNEFLDNIRILMKTPELKNVRIICSLNKEEYRNKLKTIGLTEEDSIYKIKDKEKFFKIIQELGFEEFKRQKKYFIRYLKQEGFSGNVLVSDSGWSGTIQQIIQDLLVDNAPLHIKGAYIGVRNVQLREKYKNVDRDGYLFSPVKNRNFDYMTRFTNEILERMLSNEDGSTVRYENVGDIKPILAKKMFIDKTDSFVCDIQREALRFVEKFSDSLKLFERLDIKPEVIFNGYVNFAVYPSLKNVKLFLNFNSKYEEQTPIVPNRNIFFYISHMKSLKQDLSAYCSIFLLKKLFMLPLPYYEISKFMIDKMGMKSDYRKNCENRFQNMTKNRGE